MKIEILGMGCIKCKRLYENAQAAVKELNAQAEIVKVEDIHKIMDYGIMTTPAIVIDGKVKAAGRIPASEEIKKWITEEK
ncbi:MAG: TM0996/MTH895 family glutaredoxin-like protein [Candidatus Omnitrophica bacterium]|nr:TM0996/MTH895 family glutaredoxin-like protein [Candidatus Omnitrophota bacterium]